MRMGFLVLLIITIGMVLVGCDTPLGHQDHDHDGDGIQDHAPEDHVDEHHGEDEDAHTQESHSDMDNHETGEHTN